MSSRDVTYCTGLWLLDGNEKRSKAHYLELIPRTCALIASKRLVLHCDDQLVADLFLEHARANRIDLEVVTTAVADLPFSRYAPAIVDACSRMNLGERGRLGPEKGPRHYWDHYRASGAVAYERMTAIWLSKIPLARQLATSSGGSAVAWIDSSIARFSGRRTNWRFARVRPRANRVQHYASRMTFQGKSLPINASFLQSDRSGWSRLSELFEASLQSHVSDDYCHDEETILSFCKAADPDLFDVVGAPKQTFGSRVRNLLRLS